LALLLGSAGCGQTREKAPQAAQNVSIVYGVPPALPQAPWAVYLRNVNPATGQSMGADVSLGTAVLVNPVATSSSSLPTADYVVLYGPGGSQLIRITPSGSTSMHSSKGWAIATLIDAKGNVYLSDDSSVLELNSSGAIVKQSPRPGASPPVPGQANASGVSLVSDSSRSAGLLISPSGHLLVLVDNSADAAMVDLVSGQRLELPYGWFEGQCIGDDGKIYVLLFNQGSAQDDLVLGQIDPTSMKLLHSVHLGIQPSAGRILGANLIPAGNGRLLLHVAQSPSGPALVATGVREKLFKVDETTLATNSVSMADDSGYLSSLGVDCL
jgi:hypothetical protein